MIGLRATGVSEFIWCDDEDCEVSGLWELGLLWGRSRGRGFGVSSLGAGVSFVGGELHGDEDVRRVHTVGLMAAAATRPGRLTKLVLDSRGPRRRRCRGPRSI